MTWVQFTLHVVAALVAIGIAVMLHAGLERMMGGHGRPPA